MMVDYSICTSNFKALLQAVFLVGVESSRFLLAILDCIIVNTVGFFVVSSWFLAQFLSNHKRFEVQ